MTDYREVECGGCAPAVQVPLREGKELSNIKGHNPDAPSRPKPPPPRSPPSRNTALASEGAVACFHCGAPCREVVLERGGDNGWGDDKSRTVKRYTPPASIPAAEVQALVERMDRELPGAPMISTTRYWRDELAKLARDYAPEVSQKPPSPRNP